MKSKLVLGKGVEPLRLAALPPEDSVSANFTTRATTVHQIIAFGYFVKFQS